MGTGSRMNGCGLSIDVLSTWVSRVRFNGEVYLIEGDRPLTSMGYVEMLAYLRDEIAPTVEGRFGSDVCHALTDLMLA